ncbi:unnamed protein product [Hermetia illucens]|uniref:Anosmin-1 n=1 Tax=Hermetia illucens TaxID=343691 RepID=A0A7R8UNY3_HERIL|nr:anosmin-1 isoform X2 [Hermetia illucens]CAD7084329.1 unnamed protein product [Hermetia illucens]
MIPDRFYLVYTLIVLQGISVQCRKRGHIKPHEIDENLLSQRCELLCLLRTSEKCTCRHNLSELSKKPGRCPNSTNSILEKICLDDCKEGNDYECPGTKVCCKQDCGYSCQDAVGLEDDPDLPSIPFNISVSERRCNGKMCEISWKIHQNKAQMLPVFFVVETRSHVGNVFSQRKLSPWQWCNFQKMAEVLDHATMIKKTVVSIKLKLGLWYQIRVAAINKYGYRGYSNYSEEFRLTDQPKPPRPPKNLKAYPIGYWPNDTVVARVTWSAPKSDLPIDRYKISWARHFNDNVSLYLYHDYVKEPKTSYEITNLQRDSLYYVQLQAISTNGRKRLKSSNESRMLDTTTDVLLNPSEANALLIEDEAEIRYQFQPSKKYGMLVRVSSDCSFNGSFVELCCGTDDCETKEYGAVRPRKDQIIFSKLKFNTEYTLRVFYRNSVRRKEITKTFVTPQCEKFKKSHPNLSIKC